MSTLWQKIPIFVINLRSRKDRKNYVKKHLKKNGLINFEFYLTNRHENPAMGCLESHLNVIQIAKKRKLKKIWIMEDDVVFTKNILQFPNYPPEEKWDMLYPGANVTNLLKKEVYEKWNQVTCLTTHSYIITEKMYDNLIKLINQNLNKQIDVIYNEIVHEKYIALSHYPNLINQLPDYSDIEGKYVTYNLRNGIDDNLNESIKEAEYEKVDGNIILKLEHYDDKDLPNVSVVILTGNRRNFIDIFYYYAQNFDYPKNKLEFLFIDDGQEKISDIMLRDKRFKHIHCNTKDGSRVPIFQKRDLGVKMALHDYIIFCDDDDFYPPSTVKARINTLLTYEKDGIECVGCNKIGLYDLNTGNSMVTSGKDISEASLGFTKKFWKEQGFTITCNGGEGISFIKNRHHKVLRVPYCFVLIAITHKTNVTNNLRAVENKYEKNKQTDYFDEFPLFIQEKLLKIKKNKIDF